MSTHLSATRNPNPFDEEDCCLAYGLALRSPGAGCCCIRSQRVLEAHSSPMFINAPIDSIASAVTINVSV